MPKESRHLYTFPLLFKIIYCPFKKGKIKLNKREVKLNTTGIFKDSKLSYEKKTKSIIKKKKLEKGNVESAFLEIDFAFEIGVNEWSGLEKYLHIFVRMILVIAVYFIKRVWVTILN